MFNNSQIPSQKKGLASSLPASGLPLSVQLGRSPILENSQLYIEAGHRLANTDKNDAQHGSRLLTTTSEFVDRDANVFFPFERMQERLKDVHRDVHVDSGGGGS